MPVRVIGRIGRRCKDRQQLLPLVRQIRASWYATLSNLLYTHDTGDGLELPHEKYQVPPVFALYDDKDNVCIVTPVIDSVDREYEMPEYSLFEIYPRKQLMIGECETVALSDKLGCGRKLPWWCFWFWS